MNEINHNPFKAIAPKEVAPRELKKQVMASVEFSHLLMDMAELFTIKMGNTALKMLDNVGKDHDPSNENTKKNDRPE